VALVALEMGVLLVVLHHRVVLLLLVVLCRMVLPLVLVLVVRHAAIRMVFWVDFCVLYLKGGRLDRVRWPCVMLPRLGALASPYALCAG
jgi:hypothetical protein